MVKAFAQNAKDAGLSPSGCYLPFPCIWWLKRENISFITELCYVTSADFHYVNEIVPYYYIRDYVTFKNYIMLTESRY